MGKTRCGKDPARNRIKGSQYINLQRKGIDRIQIEKIASEIFYF
jgi:hypothetical protein